mgnify:CR=1 FL=1
MDFVNIAIFLLVEFFVFDYIIKIRKRIKKFSININYVLFIHIILFICLKLLTPVFLMKTIVKYFMIATLLYIVSLYRNKKDTTFLTK